MANRPIRRGGWSWSQARVGTLIIVALVLLAYGIFRVGDLFNVFADRYPLITLVPDAAGLLEGAAVTLAGQRVGQVEEIEFLPPGSAGDNHISLHLSVDEGVQEYIREDSWARIRTQGLLGDRYIDIAPGSPGAAMLGPGDTLRSVEAVDFEDVLVTAAATLEETRALLNDLQRITQTLLQGEGTLGRLLVDQSLYDRMLSATGELQALLAEVNRADGTLSRMIHDPSLYENLERAVARVDTLGARILHGGGTLSRLLESDELYLGLLGVVGRADSTIASLGGALGGLTEAEGTIQRLLTDPSLYDEFLKAVIDLQTLINEIRANPRRFRPELKIDIF